MPPSFSMCIYLYIWMPCVCMVWRACNWFSVCFRNQRRNQSKNSDIGSNRNVRSMKIDLCAVSTVQRTSRVSEQPPSRFFCVQRKIMIHDKHFIIFYFFSSSEMLCFFFTFSCCCIFCSLCSVSLRIKSTEKNMFWMNREKKIAFATCWSLGACLPAESEKEKLQKDKLPLTLCLNNNNGSGNSRKTKLATELHQSRSTFGLCVTPLMVMFSAPTPQAERERERLLIFQLVDNDESLCFVLIISLICACVPPHFVHTASRVTSQAKRKCKNKYLWPDEEETVCALRRSFRV